MNPIPSLILNDGHSIPRVGLGVYQVPDAQAPAVITVALEAGYRSIDTAAIYQNETGTGAALRANAAGYPREKLHVTTKIWNSEHGFDRALKAVDASLKRLGLGYVDLCLIHWPLPMRNQFLDTWRALIRLRDGRAVKSIGVSNFNAAHIRLLIDRTGVAPAVNQIELHPRFQQAGLRAFHAAHGIVTESWSPLGQATFMRDATLLRIAQKHARSVAQNILRWHIQLGLVAIPKSVTPSRIRENLALFDFHLDAGDMAAIAALDRTAQGDGRIGPEPETFSRV